MKRGHRKLPFSGKKKKKQLQDKRARLANKQDDDSNEGDFETEVNDSLQQKNTNEKSLKKKIEASSSQSINDTVSIKAQDITRLNSVFEKQTPQEIRKLRNESMIPFTRLPLTALEVSKEESYTTIIDFPKRPPWNYDMTKEELESKEKHYFQEWLSNIYEQYPKEELSFFEHNLNVWRQLWRVLEISDIFLILVDIRHPLLHFPPSLYDYIVNQLKRKMFLVFNKIDLVTKNTVYAWKNYFKKEFPEIVVVEFSCYPCDKKFVDDTSTAYLQKRTKRPRKRYYQPVGIKDFLTKCSNLKLNKLGVEVDWTSLIQEYSLREQSLNNIQQGDDDGDDGDTDDDDDDERAIVKEEETYVNEEGNDKSQNELNNSDVNQIETQLKLLGVQCETTPRNNLITIGLIGHPNVGKSSFINSFMGKTVVSTSRTPGHTKHFQTIHLSANVRLCDSPGLVFPSLLSKQIQILCGLYPIAQVQEPYSSIKYLAERIRLENILKIQPTETKNEYKWSAWDICEAFAIKRGFYSGKSARPDSYRAANAILRLVIDGRILLSFKPPGFYNLQK